MQSGGEPGGMSGYTWSEPPPGVKGEKRTLGVGQASEAEMSGGFLSGLVTGAVVSGVALASVSLMSPPGAGVGGGSTSVAPPVAGAGAPAAESATAPAGQGAPRLATPEAAPEAAPAETAAAETAPPARTGAGTVAPSPLAAPEAEPSAFAAAPAGTPAVAEAPAMAAPGASAADPGSAAAPAPEPVADAGLPAAPATQPVAATPVAEPAAVAAPEPDPATRAEAPAAVAAIEVPAGSEFNRPRADVEPVAPAPQPAPAAAPAPDVIRPDAEPALRLAEITPPTAPAGDTGTPLALALPGAGEAAAAPPASEASVPVPPPGEADAPALSRDAIVDAAPAPAAPAPAAPEIAGSAADLPTAGSAISQPEDQPAVTEAVPVPEPAPDPATTTEADATPAEAADAAPSVVDEAPSPPGVARVPQPGFAQSVPGVRVNRLARIGDPVAETTGAVERSPTLLPDQPATEASEATPALRLYAAEFANPEALPLFALVLTDPDPAEGGLSPASLLAAGLPATIAIDPARDGAATRAAAYRAAGFEVAILMPDLPAGATASDLEVGYQSLARTLPEAVLFMGRAGAAFQTDRRLARHVVALLATEGRGLISDDRGLDQAGQAAAAAGLPHAAINRRIDAGTVAGGGLKRLLDRAAFEAGQTGEVVIVADGDAVTVSGLATWAGEAPKGVVLAPVSAVLLAP